MALQKAFVLVLMLALLPLVHSSRPRFQGGTTMAEENTTLATQEFEAKLVKSFEKGDSEIFTNIVEDSAREVPTGPDPLHHNNHPTGP